MAALTLKETHPSLAGKEVVLHDGCESITEEDSYCSCSATAFAIGDVGKYTIDRAVVLSAIDWFVENVKSYEDGHQFDRDAVLIGFSLLKMKLGLDKEGDT